MARRRAAAEKAKSSPNDFHRRSVAALQAANVPFLIGGAYVVEAFAGVSRRTKDFDLYIRPRHVRAAMDALAGAGYKAEMTFPALACKSRARTGLRRPDFSRRQWPMRSRCLMVRACAR